MYRAGIEEVLAPHVAAFAPTWLLLSSGFDAHRRDPLTDLGLTAGDYADVTADLLAFAPAGRRVVFLEGGYDLTASGRVRGRHRRARWWARPCRRRPRPSPAPAGTCWARCAAAQVAATEGP